MSDHSSSSDNDADVLESERLQTIEYAGRLFLKAGTEGDISFEPVDEIERLRLLQQHEVWRRAYEGRMLLVPVANPLNILDCGTGTCAWAIDAAKQFPDCTFRCIDFSDMFIPRLRPDEFRENGTRKAPWYAPPASINFDFDDLNFELPHDYDNTFDVVNSQMLTPGLHKNRWPTYIADIYRVLKPGGWLQVIESYPNAQSYNGRLDSNSALRRWSEKYLRAMEEDRNPRIGMQVAGMMGSTGFVNMEDRSGTIPLCGWSTGKEKLIGEANMANCQEYLYSAAVWKFTTGEDAMPLDKFNQLISEARAEAANEALKPYFMLYVHIGQKPYE